MGKLNVGSGQLFDSTLLEQFGIITREFYERYVGRDDDKLRQVLRSTVNWFFTGGLDTLRYQ